ncbi:hypothetical protein OGAPHI_004007 [Ogataea philodendri]|uniref:Uncharacterized protein n=1 Tax=Ogataea philodendri TaxID=1378263 RepID=A0A9P8P712_9ASCO|nr:uncharacterized protein OGAPHI_004007 [Ogataea philodendri]KAH3665819.1 hypothetical protein OGAPHI_004007 [Ogataea philodendri]
MEAIFEKSQLENQQTPAEPDEVHNLAAQSVELMSIKNAAQYVNEKLSAKGYFSNKPNKLRKLLLLSLDSDQLFKENMENLEINDKIYENDKNTMNIIYSLLNSTEISKQFKETALKKMADKDSEIRQLREEVARLNDKLEEKEKHVQSLNLEIIKFDLHSNHYKTMLNNVNAKYKEQERTFKLYTEEVKRELRRNEIEVDRLENRLSSVSKRKFTDSHEADTEPKRQKFDNDRFLSLLEDNSHLKHELNKVVAVLLRLQKFLKSFGQLNGSNKVPSTFIPSDQELLAIDYHDFDLKKYDVILFDLLKAFNGEAIEDTFKFKKNAQNDKEQEIENLRKRLTEMEQNYERVLGTMEQWKTRNRRKAVVDPLVQGTDLVTGDSLGYLQELDQEKQRKPRRLEKTPHGQVEDERRSIVSRTHVFSEEKTRLLELVWNVKFVKVPFCQTVIQEDGDFQANTEREKQLVVSDTNVVVDPRTKCLESNLRRSISSLMVCWILSPLVSAGMYPGSINIALKKDANTQPATKKKSRFDNGAFEKVLGIIVKSQVTTHQNAVAENTPAKYGDRCNAVGLLSKLGSNRYCRTKVWTKKITASEKTFTTR